MSLSKARSREEGFTLIELIVVLAIMGLLSAIALPWFVKMSQRNAVKSAAREIQSSLLAARMRAVKRNAPVSVLFSSIAPPLEFVTIEPDFSPTPTPPPVAHFSVPKLSAELVATPVGGKITFGGNGRLVSAAPPLTIVIRGPVNAGPAMNQITIEAAGNGAVRVITPVVWN